MAGSTQSMRFDVAVVGGGPAGYAAAIRAASLGRSVALVEADLLGGTCLNRGCIPTKYFLHVSGLFHEARATGLLACDVPPPFGELVARKDAVVERIRTILAALLRRKRITLIDGRAEVRSPGRLLVESRAGPVELVADALILATGSAPAAPAGWPADHPSVLTTDSALSLNSLPKSIIVVGAGAVGLEFATLFAELGCRVTLAEMADRVLPGFDPDAGRLLSRCLGRLGVNVVCGAVIEAVEPGDTECAVRCRFADGRAIQAEAVLLAVGRRPRLETLGPVASDLATDGPFVAVDGACRTNLPGVFAAGDLTGKRLLAHVAYRQGIVAAENACGMNSVADLTLVPAVVYSHPEVAAVGLQAHDAAGRCDLSVQVYKYPLAGVGLAGAYGQQFGFFKLVCDAGTGRLLGATIVAPGASEMIHEVALAIRAGLSAKDLAGLIHAHPTFSEGIAEAAGALAGSPLHAV